MKQVKILIIRVRRVGDAILSESICSTLKKSIPNSVIHFLVYDFMADLFRDDPNIDKVISINQKESHSFFKHFKKAYQLMRKERYDIIIDLRSTINTLPFSLFSLGAKYRIGQKKAYNFFIHNHRIDTFKNENYIDQKLSLLDPLAEHYNIIKSKDFKIYIKQHEVEAFRSKMKATGINFDYPVVIATVTTRVEHKRYPIEYMEEILSRVLKTYPDLQIIFNYGDAVEKEQAYEIYQHLGCPKNIFIDLEAKDLRELGAMIANCDYLFGNEGGPRHLAQALGIPSMAYFSPGSSYKQWLPNLGEDNQALSHENIYTPEESKLLSHDEKRYSVLPELVWKRLKIKLDELVDKKSKPNN